MSSANAFTEKSEKLMKKEFEAKQSVSRLMIICVSTDVQSLFFLEQSANKKQNISDGKTFEFSHPKNR